MIKLKTTILQFGKQGEKTGWTYIVVPQKLAEKINPGVKKSYRVKGLIDDYPVKQVALIPMGEGDFILPLNAVMRKGIRKRKGDSVLLSLEMDNSTVKISSSLLSCLEDDPDAMDYFKSLPGSHQNYYSKWIESAKTDSTKTKRIAIAIDAFSKKWSYSQMIQNQKAKR